VYKAGKHVLQEEDPDFSTRKFIQRYHIKHVQSLALAQKTEHTGNAFTFLKQSSLSLFSCYLFVGVALVAVELHFPPI
jgi:hypothetical protein